MLDGRVMDLIDTLYEEKVMDEIRNLRKKAWAGVMVPTRI